MQAANETLRPPHAARLGAVTFPVPASHVDGAWDDGLLQLLFLDYGIQPNSLGGEYDNLVGVQKLHYAIYTESSRQNHAKAGWIRCRIDRTIEDVTISAIHHATHRRISLSADGIAR